MQVSTRRSSQCKAVWHMHCLHPRAHAGHRLVICKRGEAVGCRVLLLAAKAEGRREGSSLLRIKKAPLEGLSAGIMVACCGRLQARDHVHLARPTCRAGSGLHYRIV